MTNKCRLPRTVLYLGVAVAMMMALGGQPAAASDEPSSGAAVEKIDPSTSSAMTWARSKARQVRYVRSQPTRVASLARPGCGWYGWSACGRPFVLMLGIGF
jgi:hypothetical protein